VVRDLEQLERSAGDAKWGRPAARPWLELSAWPRANGGATWTVNAQCAPQAGTADAGESWGAAVRTELARAAGGVLGVDVFGVKGWSQLLPADWERELGAAGGCEHHGDMLLDQMLLLRGTERASGARTEIDGLLLCGSGAHPGGGVTGLPGWHAAEEAARALS
jgi:phytoene dehydrogenase-like protein